MSTGLPLSAARVWLVTGKGGTGKTSIAASLALMAAARGIPTVAIELDRDEPLRTLLDARPHRGETRRGDGRTPIELAPHLFTLRIDPLRALEEYLELQLHAGLLVRPVLRSAAFARLLEATPGWRELITLGKIWHLEQKKGPAGAPRYGVLIVDAPATGHGLSLLSAPQIVVDMVRMGPLRRQTEQVQAMLLDPRQTRVLPVTLAEELPVLETLELCQRTRELGLTLGPVVANALEPASSIDPADDVWDRLRALGARADLPPLAEPRALLEIHRYAQQRGELQARFVRELEERTGTRVLTVPRLLEPIADTRGAQAMADALGAVWRESGPA